MNPKTVVILVAILAVAGLAYVLTQRGGSAVNPNGADDPSDSTNTESPLLSEDLLGSSLRSITIDGGLQGTLLELERVQGTWWVTKPSHFRANPDSIDELLTTLSELTGSPSEDDHRGLVPDSPGIFLGHGLQLTQLFSNNRLGAGRAAVTVIQDGFYTNYNATDTLQDIFDGLEIDRFYANSLNPPLMPEVGRIDIKTPDGSSTLIQHNGHWWIEHADSRERALETGLPGYPGVQALFKLFDAKLIRKQSDNPPNGMASYGLDDPLISVRFIPHDKDPGQAYEIHLGTPADSNDQTRYVSNGVIGQAIHPVFKMATEFALAFGQDATAFRDPRIMATHGTLIESIQLTFADAPLQTIELPSDGKPVLVVGDDDRHELSIERVALAFKQLSDARAMDYVPTQLSEWYQIVSALITPRLGGEPEDFTVYADPDSEATNPTVLVHRGQEPVALRVAQATVAGLIDPASLVVEDGG